MKNFLISITLGVFLASCSQAKYSNLDSQFTNNSNQSIVAKYNCKNLHKEEARKKEVVRQLAIVTGEE